MELNLTNKKYKFCNNDNEIIAFLTSLYVNECIVEEFRTIKEIKLDSDTKICRLVTKEDTTLGFHFYNYDYTTVDSKCAVVLSFSTYYGYDARLILFPDDNKIDVIIKDTKAPKLAYDKQKTSLFLLQSNNRMSNISVEIFCSIKDNPDHSDIVILIRESTDKAKKKVEEEEISYNYNYKIF